jgi:hypothetical protein
MVLLHLNTSLSKCRSSSQRSLSDYIRIFFSEDTCLIVTSETPTQPKTTYVNDRYNYSFDYPTSWFLKDDGLTGSENDHKRIVIVSPYYIGMVGAGGSGPQFKNTFHIRFDDLSGGSKIPIISEFKESEFFKADEVYISGLSAVMVESIKELPADGENGFPLTSYYVPINGGFFHIYYNQVDLESDKKEAILKIISSLKFSK